MAEIAPTTTTQIKTVQLGDPGVGFDLHFSKEIPIPASATIMITLKVLVGDKTHTSVLTIQGPVTEDHTTIVMPYGCDHYVPGDELQIEIMGQINPALLPVVQDHAPYFVYYKGQHVAQNGDFNFRVRRNFLAPLNEPLDVFIRSKKIYKRRGSVLLSGESLQSLNGRYRCRLEYDGQLCIYDLEAVEPMAKKWSSGYNALIYAQNPAKGHYFAVMGQDGVLYVFENTQNLMKVWDSYTDATRGRKKTPHPPTGNYHLVMRDNGILCLSSHYPVTSDNYVVLKMNDL